MADVITLGFMACPQCPGCKYYKSANPHQYTCGAFNQSAATEINIYKNVYKDDDWFNRQKPVQSCKLYESDHPEESSSSSSRAEESSGNEDYEPPRKKLTEEEILDGIEEYGKASREAFQQSLEGEEDCVAGVTGIKGAGVALRDVPEHLKTPRVCLAAVTNYGGALEYVPDNLRTAELCQAAVSNYGGAIRDVPKKLVTPELCLTAVAQDAYAITSVPEKFKTPEFFMAAVSKNGETLQYAPEDLKTMEFCMAAVSKKGKALEHVPENLKTLELCRAAVIQDGSALEYVPVKMKKMLVYLKSPPPAKGKAYVFLILTGFIGGHRFYLKKIKTGILFFLLFALGVGGYPLALIPLAVWFIIDCITLGRQIKKIQERYKGTPAAAPAPVN